MSSSRPRNAAALAALGLAIALVGCGSTGSGATAKSAAAPTATATAASIVPSPVSTYAYGSAPCPAAGGSTPKPASFAGAPMKCIEDGATYSAVVTTSSGQFTIALDAVNSPGTVNNFIALARYHYYDGTGCHRVIAGFVVQCGRPGADESAPGYTIPDELPGAGQYAEGVVAMANTGQPNSGGGQWFIITGVDGASLPPQYAIVGRVAAGYDTTVKALEALADPSAPNGVPTLSPISITSVVIQQG